MRISHLVLSATMVALLSSVSVAANAAAVGAIKVNSMVQSEVEVVGEDGKKHIERKPVQKAIPGAAILFINTFENISKKPAGDIVINNPVPVHTEYQAGSAYGDDTEMTFSVDGGKNFAAADVLKVKAADGSEQLAKASAYTNIRWSYKKQLPPGVTAEVGFRAVIK